MVQMTRRLSGDLAHGVVAHGRDVARRGFTLIEISMVLLLFAAAIGGLLSFFPVGLKLESNAISDTSQTMFALNILGQVEARAAEITDWNVWNDGSTGGNNNKFLKAAFKNIEVEGKKLSFNFKFLNGDDYYAHCWRTDPANAAGFSLRDNWRYVVQCSPVTTPLYFGKGVGSVPDNCVVRRIAIWVTDHRDGDPTQNTPFVRDLVFRGSVADNVSNGKP